MVFWCFVSLLYGLVISYDTKMFLFHSPTNAASLNSKLGLNNLISPFLIMFSVACFFSKMMPLQTDKWEQVLIIIVWWLSNASIYVKAFLYRKWGCWYNFGHLKKNVVFIL